MTGEAFAQVEELYRQESKMDTPPPLLAEEENLHKVVADEREKGTANHLSAERHIGSMVTSGASE